VATWATAVIVLAALVFCVAINWPGHLSYDSVIQLYEGRFAAYDNWHPPIMSWMLGFGDYLLPGASLFMAFDALLVFGAFLLLLLQQKPSFWAVPAALCIMALPQLLLYPAIVWKDVLFAGASLAGFVLLVCAARHWQRFALRLVLISGAFLLFSLAALARQNGMLVLLIGALTLAVIALQEKARIIESAGYGIASLLCAVLVMTGTTFLLSRHYTGVSGPGRQITLLQLYDLIGVEARDARIRPLLLEQTDPRLATAMETDGVRLFTPIRNDTLHNSAPLQEALYDTQPRFLQAQWVDLLQHHPAAYLASRWEIFRWVFFTPDIMRCVPFVVGVDGPPNIKQQLRLAERLDNRDRALEAYGYAFSRTPVFRHPLFAFIAIAVTGFLLWRHRPEDTAIVGLQIAALVFTASFFVISLACDYRYLYFLDLSALAGLFYVALDPRIRA
jgi:hypothetical protein